MSAQQKAQLQTNIDAMEQDCIKAAQSTKKAALELKQAQTHESALTHKLEELHHQLAQLKIQDTSNKHQNIPLSVALTNHEEITNEEPTAADKRYFAGIPAQITRGTEHTPAQSRRPTRGDIVMISRQYTSKIPNLSFPQLHVIGAVKYSDPQRDRIGITVEPGKTVEKSWRNTVTLLEVPNYNRAHINDMYPSYK